MVNCNAADRVDFARGFGPLRGVCPQLWKSTILERPLVTFSALLKLLKCDHEIVNGLDAKAVDTVVPIGYKWRVNIGEPQ